MKFRPGVQVKIVDPLTGELQGPNQVGEILAKNATMMKGYLKRDEENKKFFTEDGFARTGDLGLVRVGIHKTSYENS